jgi:branched-chain amino acid transport system permease protein
VATPAPWQAGLRVAGRWSRPASWLLAAAFFVYLLAVPVTAKPYSLHLTVITLMYAVLALSWDICARTGQLSLAHAGLFGLGVYVAGLGHTRLSLDPLVTLVAAGVVAGAVAAGLGWITLRLQGIYFAVATLAFSEVLRTMALQFPGLTGGAIGLNVPPLFGGRRVLCYYLILGLFALAFAVSTWLRTPRFRLAFEATRTRSEVAGVLGVNVVACRVLAFTASAALAGMAGAFYMHYITFANPYDAFSLNISVMSLVMPVSGGLYTTAGPILGCFLLRAVEEYLRTTIVYGYMIAYGLILVVVIMFMPQGILGALKGLARYLAGRLGVSG